MKISVVTPSVREEGLEMVRRCLNRQSFRDFEWLVCSPFHYYKAHEWIPEPEKRSGDMYNLNKCWNLLFNKARGDLIVSIVDMQWFAPDVLDNLWAHYHSDPKSCVGGIGDQYAREENGKPEGMVWSDPRRKSEIFYQVPPIDYELCLASIPRQAIVDVGGVDEEFDKYAAMSEKELCLRIAPLGYRFYIDQTIEYRAMKHPRLTTNWDERYFAGQPYFKRCIDDIVAGKRSKLGYLTNNQTAID